MESSKYTKSSRCAHPECAILDAKKRPKATYGFKSQGQCRCCKHAEAGMIRIVGVCQTGNCQITATYGLEIQNKVLLPIACSRHKTAEMRTKDNRVCRHCADEGKKTRPAYGRSEDGIAISCSRHNKEYYNSELKDLLSKKCKLCDKQPAFGLPGLKKKEYCAEHKTEGMVNIAAAKCAIDECEKQPKYGFNKAEVCGPHKQQGMKNFGKTCVVCKKVEPIYAVLGNVASHCSNCKGPDMVDVKNSRCQFPDCDVIAQYGFLGTKSRSCRQHVAEYMQNLPQTKCKQCPQYAQYGITTKPVRCLNHKVASDLHLCMRMCVTCTKIDILNDSRKCNICAEELFRQRRLHKQQEVRCLIEHHFKILQYDSSIGEKIRPDFVIQSQSDHKIILEVDEEQHKRYKDKKYDSDRMAKIASIMKKVTCVRFNPDSYVNSKGVKKTTTIQERFEVLKKCIEEFQDYRMPGEEGFVLKKLFFDGYDDGSI